MNIPKAWTTIAIFSASEGRFIPAPGAKITEAQTMGNPAIQRRTVSVGGRKIMQVRAK
ncbi:hypothetical protein LDL36_13840 [Komagataeibacter sp. FNDCR1]|nr:hypothetical protein [Komagataeibacter sp. FNDCR1]